MGFYLSVAQTRSPRQCLVCHHTSLLFGSNTHGAYYVKKEKDLLPLLLRCRQIYSEAIHILYATNAFQFIQPFYLRSFVNTLLTHYWSSIRRLRFYLPFEQHLALNARTWSDWTDIWAFFLCTLGGLMLLRVSLEMDRVVVQHIYRE